MGTGVSEERSQCKVLMEFPSSAATQQHILHNISAKLTDPIFCGKWGWEKANLFTLLEINQTFSSLQFMRRKKSQLRTPTLAEFKNR